MTCSLGLGLWAALSGAGGGGGAATAAGGGAAGIAGCISWAAAAPMRLMRTASSPSLISISAMPDSSSSSISFLIFRMSMCGWPPKARGGVLWRAAETLRGGTDRRLVAEGAEAADHAHGGVREIGVTAKGLARVRVGKVHLDERHPHRQQRIAQRDAGMREGAGIDDEKRHALGTGTVHALDQLVLGVALKGDELVPALARHGRGARLDVGQGVRAVEGRLPRPQKIEVRAVKQQHSR